MLPGVLIVDDEESTVRGINAILRHHFRTFSCTNPVNAMKIVEQEIIDVVILDVMMPKIGGIELLGKIREIDQDIIVIMYTALNEAAIAVKAMKAGAHDYCVKPIDPDELIEIINRSLNLKTLNYRVASLEENLHRISGNKNLIWKSKSFQSVLEQVHKAAKHDVDVLIIGETGTGKELIANSIREIRNNHQEPFITVDCGSILPELLNSELFGHEKGSFTSAVSRRRGKFELADGGILFLDEIGNISNELQAALLRVLETREFYRIGGERTIQVDVRIIAATNKNLKKMVDERKFKEDLYYRLNRFPICLPPLREREEDIEPLVYHFLTECSHRFGSKMEKISEQAFEMLKDYSWPGNIRELKNIIEQVCILHNDVKEITPSHLPLNIQFPTVSAINLVTSSNLSLSLEQVEHDIIQQILINTNWNQSKTAKILGIPRSSLQWRMTKYNLNK